MRKQILSLVLVAAIAVLSGFMGATIQDSRTVGNLHVHANAGNFNDSVGAASKALIEGDAGNVLFDGAIVLRTQSTIADDDATPDVGDESWFITGGNTDTITNFDGTNIAAGQIILVESDAAITYDVTSSGLVCGDTDVVTADGDWTGWVYNGTDWVCFFFMDLDDNANTWGAA